MVKTVIVAGARPNFMKVAPLMTAMQRRPTQFQPVLVHTGQHYDSTMSDMFFRDLAIPDADIYLGVGSGSHAAQTAAVMQAFEPILEREKPDWVVVVGDVNSTLACALVAVKLGVKVAHVEAGLRSRDRSMPEEINRLLTDQLSDLLLTPSKDADANLLAEGISGNRIRMVGNIMIDTLLSNLDRVKASTVRTRLGIENIQYAVLTLHRPSNVDESASFAGIIEALAEIGKRLPVIFPAHPRTTKMIAELGLGSAIERARNVRLIEPLGYLDFLALLRDARLALTDSGGIQEESTVLGVPCITLRQNTERPITVEMGTNTIAGTNPEKIIEAALRVLDHQATPAAPSIPLWDGHTADRVLDALLEATSESQSATTTA